MTREEFVDWLDTLIVKAVPENFEEFTHRQLTDYVFDVVFDSMEDVGLVPAEGA